MANWAWCDQCHGFHRPPVSERAKGGNDCPSFVPQLRVREDCGVCGGSLLGIPAGWLTCRVCGRKVHKSCMLSAFRRDCGCRSRVAP